MPYDVECKLGAIEDVTALFDYIAENSSLWDARNVTDRVSQQRQHPHTVR